MRGGCSERRGEMGAARRSPRAGRRLEREGVEGRREQAHGAWADAIGRNSNANKSYRGAVQQSGSARASSVSSENQRIPWDKVGRGCLPDLLFTIADCLDVQTLASSSTGRVRIRLRPRSPMVPSPPSRGRGRTLRQAELGLVQVAPRAEGPLEVDDPWHDRAGPWVALVRTRENEGT